MAHKEDLIAAEMEDYADAAYADHGCARYQLGEFYDNARKQAFSEVARKLQGLGYVPNKNEGEADFTFRVIDMIRDEDDLK